MVEICAGSAVLSAEAQKNGFQVFPIDHAHNRFRAAASILVVDLTNPDAKNFLPLHFQAVRPQWCHMGPPVWHLQQSHGETSECEAPSSWSTKPTTSTGSRPFVGVAGLTQSEQIRGECCQRGVLHCPKF